MEFIIRYTMNDKEHNKVVIGKNEVEARTLFANEMKQLQYVIIGIDLKESEEDKEEKTTKEKMDDDEVKHKA